MFLSINNKFLFFGSVFLFCESVSIAAESGVKFSSKYYDTAKDCVCSTSNLSEDEECLNFSCKDMLGYHFEISYDGSACDDGTLLISKNKFKLPPIKTVPNKIELRIAGNIPFAIIYRIKENYYDYCVSKTDKKPVQVLKAQGLENFEGISSNVLAKEKNVNEKIRDLVDKEYKKLAKQ